MRLIKGKRYLEYTLSESVEDIIRNGLFNWIENRDYRDPLDSVATFAESLGVTECEVAEFLSYNMDIKYCTLRRLLRIQDAALMLLLFPLRSLGSIGRMVGYTDPSNFRNQFRGYTRLSPGDWRRRVEEKRKAPRPTRDNPSPSAPILRFRLPIFPVGRFRISGFSFGRLLVSVFPFGRKTKS